MYTLSTLLPFIDFSSGLLGLAVAVLMYVGLSLGLFLMARSMKLKTAWMAWFPIIRVYLAGAAIDHTLAKTREKKTNHAKGLMLVRIFQKLSVWLPPVLSVLLILSIVLTIGGGVALAYFYSTGDFGLLPVNAESLFDAETIEVALGSTGYNLPAWLVLTVAIILIVLIVGIPVVLFCTTILISIVAPYLAIAFTIYYHVALYYAFAALNRRHAPLFTTLSALFDFAAPLFLPIAAKGGLDKDVFPDEEAPAQETPAPEAAAEVEAAVEQ